MAEAVVRLTPEEAIIYIMVLASASDGRMSPKELRMIGRVVRTFSMFDGFDEEELVSVSERCGALMASEGGLHKVLEAAKAALPSHLNETAYAAAIEVVTADESLNLEELRVLDLLRETLNVPDDGATAIEHSARVRHLTIEPVV